MEEEKKKLYVEIIISLWNYYTILCTPFSISVRCIFVRFLSTSSSSSSLLFVVRDALSAFQVEKLAMHLCECMRKSEFILAAEFISRLNSVACNVLTYIR